MSKTAVKIFAVIIAAITVLACVGCGAATSDGTGTAPSGTDPSGQSASDARPEVFSQDEYLLYQNVFYADYGKELDGKEVSKEGVFATIYDAYNGRQRYYVWGYYDQTKCCDWQWEIVPQNADELPPVGSLVSASGTFASSADALDGYWITDASVKVKTEYRGPAAERDMCSLSWTLERVQMINVMNRKDAFEDDEFLAYGRIASANTLEDPYYDNSWEIELIWDGDVPAIGTLVVVSGTIRDGKLAVESISEM
ncbi:MAG: hypothetical protein IIZ35_04650 [Clostridia bacterium]|nr:hypothetical protein [Clostridia bacterium]